MKIVINKCYGGFWLSSEAVKYLIAKGSSLIKRTTYFDYTGGEAESVFENERFEKEIVPVGDGFFSDNFIESTLYDKTGKTVWMDRSRSIENRTHPDLIELVETLGKKANSRLSELEIVEVPDGIQWEINDYYGIEAIEEQHRSWS